MSALTKAEIEALKKQVYEESPELRELKRQIAQLNMINNIFKGKDRKK